MVDEYLEQEKIDEWMIDIISDIYLEEYKKQMYFEEQENLYELYCLLVE